MAHFAEIRTDNNKVVRVVVKHNSDVDANGGDLSVSAENWVKDNTPQCPNVLFWEKDEAGNYPDTYWKQTSYNNNFRKQYASIDGNYDQVKDEFTTLQPFASWTLDENNDWQPPVTKPVTITYGDGTKEYAISWDEDNQRWLGHDNAGAEFVYDVSSDSWSATGNSL